VKILVACRAIVAEEEITISHVNFRTDHDSRKERLRTQYRFDSRCTVCTDSATDGDLVRMIRLDRKLVQAGSMGRTKVAMIKGQELLKLYSKYDMFSWKSYRTYYDLFQTAVTRRQTLARANCFVRQAHGAILASCHESSESVQKLKSLINAPQSQRNYLRLD
jgi:hypothetical protein